MKQLSRVFLTVALLVPALAFANSCNSDNSCNTTCASVSNGCNSSNSCNTSCNSGCASSCNVSGFNSCVTSVCNTSVESSCYCPTVFIKRPTYDNTALYYDLDYQHRYDLDQAYGGFMLAFEYQRSFDGKQLARGLFGSNVLNFAGAKWQTQ